MSNTCEVSNSCLSLQVSPNHYLFSKKKAKSDSNMVVIHNIKDVLESLSKTSTISLPTCKENQLEINFEVANVSVA